MPEAFEERLKTNVVQKVEELIKDYPVEVMEVIGHTDGTSPAGSSNFDELLPGFVMDGNAQSTIDNLKIGSNAELGLARALAVASVLTREFSKSNNANVRAIVARVSSAAQLSEPPSGNILGAPQKVDMPERRRIDLRFTKRDDTP